MSSSLPELEQRRAELYGELADTGDFRRGSVSATYRRCGKANCACADPAHPGHGPRHLLTRSVEGKTEARQVAPGPELDKVNREVANYKRFLTRVEQIVEVNEAICQDRPVSPLVGQVPLAGQGPEKGGSSARSKRSSPTR
jgi:hypothetical protein